MNNVAAAFWGAFFGSGALMLFASLTAFALSLQRVALTSGVSCLISVLFVIVYLGWLPVGDAGNQLRLLAHVAALCAAVLGLMLLSMLGVLRQRETAQKARGAMLVLALLVLASGWVMPPLAALVLSSGMAFGVGMVALAFCIRSALRGDRLAWVALSGVLFMIVALSGLTMIAVDPAMPWPVHAVASVAGICYLISMGIALWARYSYLLEVREVMAHGPSYDPVTRMRSHAETGQMLDAAFARQEGERRPVGVIVVSVSNLYSLENLHGRAAVNHALFVCAARLRRCVPLAVEMGRLSDDGFLLLLRNPSHPQALVHLARNVAARLARPVLLGTSQEAGELEDGGTQWVAGVGVGVLQAQPKVRPAGAVGMARAMSRTAWSYASRIAWYDHDAGQIAELPASDAG